MDEAVPNEALTTGIMPRQRMSPTDCPACPAETRNLYAVASNAMNAFDAMRKGEGGDARFYRKMEELRDGVERIRPLVDAHFSDPAHAKIFRDR